jgi:hypothetical protein
MGARMVDELSTSIEVCRRAVAAAGRDRPTRRIRQLNLGDVIFQRYRLEPDDDLFVEAVRVLRSAARAKDPTIRALAVIRLGEFYWLQSPRGRALRVPVLFHARLANGCPGPSPSCDRAPCNCSDWPGGRSATSRKPPQHFVKVPSSSVPNQRTGS